jgi:hypothetical protein
MNIVTCHGTEYATGGTEVEPATPPTIEGYTTVSYYKILRVYVSDSTISTYTDYTYLLGGYKELTDNLADAEATIISKIGTVSEQIASDLQSSVETLETTVSNMQTTFQDGVDTIYNAIVAEGVTPSSSTPEACATGITDIYNAAQSVTWSETVSGFLGGGNRVEYSIKNATAIQLVVNNETEVDFINTSGGTTGEISPVLTKVLSAGTYTLTPITAYILITPGDVISDIYTLTITRQAKILR